MVERVKELEHRGFQFEAADGSFDLLLRRETGEYEPLFRLESWRVIAEKREDGRVQTEATIKIWVDGERYVRTAEGNGPVHALDRALRAAIGERYPHLRDIKLVNYKVRILDEWKATGATTRVLLDASDGTDTWGAIGVHENVIEACWDALVDSLEAGMLPGGRRRARPRDAPGVTPDEIPLARPVIGEAEERGACSRCCAPASSRSARACRPSSRRSRARRGAAHASAVSSGTAALHLALRAVGVSDGDEVVTSPFSFVASANAILYERARAGVRRHRPGDAQPRPATPRPRRSPSARPRCCPSTSSATRPTCPRFERHGLPIVEDACEALGARHADGTPVGGRGHPAAFGFYANKQLTTGEGGMLTIGSAEHKERIDSERNQGRAPDMGWLDHDRLGFNYRLSDVACALGLAQLERLDDMLAGRARVAGWYREALGRWRRARPRAAVRGRAAATCAAGSCSSSSSRTASTATRRSARCASTACSPSPTCRRST